MDMDTSNAVAIPIPTSRLHDIVVNGLDNNAFNYWGRIDWKQTREPAIDLDAFAWLPEDDRRFYREHDVTMHSFAPFNGGRLTIREHDEPAKAHHLDADALRRGLAVLAEKYPHHLADIIAENDDIWTADALFQCALLGDLVYG
jgi:hypothetical protein